MPNPTTQNTPAMTQLLEANHRVRNTLATWEFASTSERHASMALAECTAGDPDLWRLTLQHSRALRYADVSREKYEAAIQARRQLNDSLSARE
jgi:hypothetical protein